MCRMNILSFGTEKFVISGGCGFVNCLIFSLSILHYTLLIIGLIIFSLILRLYGMLTSTGSTRPSESRLGKRWAEWLQRLYSFFKWRGFTWVGSVDMNIGGGDCFAALFWLLNLADNFPNLEEK